MVNEDQAYLLGYWLGDGWISSRGRGQEGYVQLNGNEHDLERVTSSLMRQGWNSEAKDRPEKTSWKLSPGVGFRDFLRGLGVRTDETSFTKQIPTAVMSWPQSCQRAVVEGLWDSDGHIQIREPDSQKERPAKYGTLRITFGSRSEKLVDGLKSLLDGFTLLVRKRSDLNGHSVQHTLEVSRRSAHEFRRLIKLQPYKQSKLDRGCELFPAQSRCGKYKRK